MTTAWDRLLLATSGIGDAWTRLTSPNTGSGFSPIGTPILDEVSPTIIVLDTSQDVVVLEVSNEYYLTIDSKGDGTIIGNDVSFVVQDIEISTPVTKDDTSISL